MSTVKSSMKTLLFKREGPMVQYDGDLLHISDLNPEQKITWRLSRKELFTLGCKCIREAWRRQW